MLRMVGTMKWNEVQADVVRGRRYLGHGEPSH